MAWTVPGTTAALKGIADFCTDNGALSSTPRGTVRCMSLSFRCRVECRISSFSSSGCKQARGVANLEKITSSLQARVEAVSPAFSRCIFPGDVNQAPVPKAATLSPASGGGAWPAPAPAPRSALSALRVNVPALGRRSAGIPETSRLLQVASNRDRKRLGSPADENHVSLTPTR